MVLLLLIAHELGHAFGLDPGREGVDGDGYSLQAYPSVMNHNGIYRTASYSDGSGDVGRNEWAFVARDRYRPAVRATAECSP
ncbi:MAG: hypothetical protein ABEH35_09165 [Haloarculaceae archaeon]